MLRQTNSRFTSRATVVASILAVATFGTAQADYPTQDLTLIVPWGAGGGADTSARLLAPEMEDTLGVSIEIINRPGGGSQIGLTELSRSEPDGYTFGFVSLPAGMTVYLDPEMQAAFSREDLQPIALMNVDPVSVVVRSDSPYESIGDLIEAAREAPGEITASITGTLSDTHLAALLLMDAADIDLRLVNFTGGTEESLPAMLGGHVDVSFGVAGSHGSLYEGGEVRILGVMDDERSPFFPEVPTLAEEGYDVTMASSRGFVAPAGFPEEALETIALSIEMAMEDEEVLENMRAGYLPPRFLGPEDFSEYWDQLEDAVRPHIDLAREMEMDEE